MKKIFTLLALSLLTLFAQAQAQKKIYAVLNNTTLTLYYDNQWENRLDYLSGWNGGWHNSTPPSITKVILDVSMKNARPTRTDNWFRGLSQLQTIQNLNYLNTSEVTNMSAMFSHCSGLVSLDVSTFNTSKVTDMSCMFSACSGLVSLDVSTFNTSNVTDMSCMFSDCSGLVSLDVSTFNTSNVTNMSYMFSSCSGLVSLDVSSFNTSNVTHMEHMFDNCAKLNQLDVSRFNTSKVEWFEYMFRNCATLASLDVNNFNLTKAKNITALFKGCIALQTIYCENDWSVQAPTSCTSYIIFSSCSNLVGGNGTIYDSNHMGIEYARPDLPNQPGYFTSKPPVIADAVSLRGVFSVSADKKVNFSQGNLQYIAAAGTWAFAGNQYDIVGNDNSGISSFNTGWIDLFGWGTSGYHSKDPWMTSYNDEDYTNGNTNDIYGTDYDWGHYNSVANGGAEAGVWYTMPQEEWNYLLRTRPNASQLQGIATVNNNKAYILLPDNWEQPSSVSFTALAASFSTNTYTADQWKIMENAGAVCLPAGGYRNGKKVSGLDSFGRYWTSSSDSYDKAQAYEAIFGEGSYMTMKVERFNKSYGLSVRLVKVADTTPIENVQSENVQSTKILRNGMLLIDCDGRTYNAQGAEVK